MEKLSLNSYAALIETWAQDKGILDKATPITQLAKLAEEVGEVAKAITRGDLENAKEELGDVFVVITIMAALLKFPVDEAVKTAYDKISKRSGEMKDGVFVKSEEKGE